MKNKLTYLTTLSAATVLFFLLSGCYTQLRTERYERSEAQQKYREQPQEQERSYAEQTDTSVSPEGNTIINNYYYDDNYADWHPRYHVGFSYYCPSYYWPSYAFTVAYNNPWYYDYYYAYDPWWCGTPYVGYYYPYYPSYYYYYPHYTYGYGGNYTAGRVHHGTRDFGSTRGGTTRGTIVNRGGTADITGRSTYDLPRGMSSDRNGYRISRGSNPTTVNNSPRQDGSQRNYVPRRDDGSRVQINRGNRGTGNHNSDARDTRPQSRVYEQNSPRPVYSAPHDRGGYREVGTPRNTAPSYSPPVRTYSPPPPASRGGGAPSNGGTRGGSSRDGGRR